MAENLSEPVVTYSKGLDGSWGYWVQYEWADGAGWGSFGFDSKVAAMHDYEVQRKAAF